MVVRNTGGAVTGVVLMLFIAPPLIVQLVNDAATWTPSPLATSLAGVSAQAAGVESQPSAVGALAGLLAWAAAPALIGLVTVQRRDVA